MIIALDYDNTYTADPILWNQFIKDSIDRGHAIWCVTARSPHHIQEVEQTIGLALEPNHIIATDGGEKRRFLKEIHNLRPDIWIDDNPESIVNIRLLGVR